MAVKGACALTDKEEKPTRGLWAKEWDNRVIWPWEAAHNPWERERVGNWVSVTARETVRGRSQTRFTVRGKAGRMDAILRVNGCI